MIKKSTGAITPELYVTGEIDLPAFLLTTELPAVIDAGMTFMGKRYAREIRKVLDGRPPAYFFLTHTHYDHCGAVAVLQEAFPDMQICCASAGAEVLKRPRAVETIRDLNRAGAQYLESMIDDAAASPEFETFPVDRTLADGDTLGLGDGVSVQAIATPGHTRDSMSFYVPEKKMLFTGEAVGIMEDSGYIFAEWLSDYNDYLASLCKLAELEVEILCPGHGCVLTGEDAAGFIPRAIAYCKAFRQLIEQTLADTGGDAEATKARIKAQEYDPLPEPKQPEFAYLINLDAKIRAIQNL
ncbi:MAG: MBL fold metallo-hydrolase [Thermodesulfobacteriota bacterium]